jgi:SAM-dependent methyltransferase
MGEEQPVTLADAYALVTPQDSRQLYARWAATYESDFVARNQYVIPDRVAEVFAGAARRAAGRVDGPVLDVGCGTGLVAVALVRDAAGDGIDWVIDGVDISPEMLAVSGAKIRPDGRPLYRQLLEADLTAAADIPDGSYAGVLSAGTFTHGHLGPTTLSTLIRFGRPGAVFAIGINAEHFAAMGFAGHLAAELAAGTIRDLEPRVVEMYLPESEHYGETAVVAVFRRAA